MPAQRKSKREDLVKILLEHFDQNKPLESSVATEIENEINHLPFKERAYAKAWFYAALGAHEEAVACFEEAMYEDDPIIASNYLAYLGRSAHNYDHRLELFRLSEVYCTHTIRKVARSAAFCIGNEKLVRKFSRKMAALQDGEERERILREGEYMEKLIVDFKKATQLTTAELERLCDSAEAIANRHGVNCVGVSYFMGSEDDNAFILRAQTEDPEKLADMNMELICMLSGEEYSTRPFTSWFQSVERGSIIQ